METFEKRVESVEFSLNKKAEKKKVDDLDAQFKESSIKLDGLTKDISTLSIKMELSLSDPSEIGGDKTILGPQKIVVFPVPRPTPWFWRRL